MTSNLLGKYIFNERRMSGINLSSEYANTAIKAIDEKSEELRTISLQVL